MKKAASGAEVEEYLRAGTKRRFMNRALVGAALDRLIALYGQQQREEGAKVPSPDILAASALAVDEGLEQVHPSRVGSAQHHLWLATTMSRAMYHLDPSRLRNNSWQQQQQERRRQIAGG